MAEVYRFRKSRKFNYDEQGLLYFICRNYKKMPKKVKIEIKKTCKEACGDYWEPVFEYITSKKSFVKVCVDYYISEYTLCSKVTKFYNKWEFKKNQS